VTQMPFENNKYQLTVCCQVLERLPFTEFLPALKQVRRVTEKR